MIIVTLLFKVRLLFSYIFFFILRAENDYNKNNEYNELKYKIIKTLFITKNKQPGKILWQTKKNTL